MTMRLVLSIYPAVVIIGLTYFAIIFTFAFAMGIARVLLEIPILLTASCFAARHLIRDRSFTLPQLVLIGAIAFAMTMVSEAVLADMIQGQSVRQWARL